MTCILESLIHRLPTSPNVSREILVLRQAILDVLDARGIIRMKFRGERHLLFTCAADNACAHVVHGSVSAGGSETTVALGTGLAVPAAVLSLSLPEVESVVLALNRHLLVLDQHPIVHRPSPPSTIYTVAHEVRDRFPGHDDFRRATEASSFRHWLMVCVSSSAAFGVIFTHFKFFLSSFLRLFVQKFYIPYQKFYIP